ncbi:hypothetical protein ACFU76_34625, partial [Streptomyces sp. NPDC057539]|uniref:hypothetical protein n=1 Tax=Streptomyces sp. NPDC057539 TaxID=3346159 RepID=UPI003683672D
RGRSVFEGPVAARIFSRSTRTALVEGGASAASRTCAAFPRLDFPTVESEEIKALPASGETPTLQGA